MNKLTINLANIHCEECEKAVRNVFTQFFKLTDSTDSLRAREAILELRNNEVTLITNEDVQHILKPLTKNLKKAGFVVISWELQNNEEIVATSQSGNQDLEANHEPDGFIDIVGFFQKFTRSKSKKNHLDYCKVCQESEHHKKKKSIDSTSEETVIEVVEQEFRASFLVSGMTCASCVQSISENLKSVLGQSKIEEEPNFSVNIIEQSLVAIIPNKQLINKIVDTVNDLGFECKLIEVLPVQRSINTKVNALIGGMTCSACAVTIDDAIKDLPFVLESGINVLTKTGQFIIEDDGKNVDKLREVIEDCGYEFQLLSTEKINYTSGKQKPRTINLKIDGMFCSHCPDVITQYLSKYGDAVVIEDPISLEHPLVKFTYLPSPAVTARKILFDLNHIQDDGEGGFEIFDDIKGPFECEIVKPVSIDEHVRKLARRELLGLAIRLGIAAVFSIPTFIFGIVAMALLPKKHPFRIWVEDPLWVGNVSRNSWILFILATPVYFFAADTFHRKAFKEIKSLWFHKNSFKARLFKFGSMNLLMSLGTTVAYFASIVLIGLSSTQEPMTHKGFHTTYFDAVVFLSFFLLIGKLLQSYSKTKTADAISQLSNLKQSSATLVSEDGKEDTRIDLQLLEIGDHIRIGTGESPPIDCVLVDGDSEFDESALTGESTPVKHVEGHQIFSGTVNIGNNSVIGKVTSLEGDSLLNQIVNTVRDGQLRKAPMERTADLITGYFVPIIVFIAILTWIIWLALGHSGALPEHYLDIDVGGWTVWSLEFAISVFVIACPCGIGLAAPTALFVGSGLAAKNGILAKGGGVAFQDGASVNVVCFDKTGTLTKGELNITNYHFPDKTDVIKTIALQVARDLEVPSNHPLAKAVKAFIELESNGSLEANKIPQVETVPGRGLRGDIVLDEEEDANDIWNEYKPTEALLGNEKLMVENGVQFTSEQHDMLNRWKTESKSVILVALKCEKHFGDDEFHLVLALAARDQLRQETKKVIELLQKKNIECWMITGDNKLTADAIAKEIGIENVVSEVLPDEKESQIKKIRQLKSGDKKPPVIAMVGDGINDAPALAAADVGIALSSGADLAVTSSDFILLNKLHPLVSLATLLEVCSKVFNRVKLNFAWSLVYNMVALPIAAGVIYPYNNSRLDPVWAAAAMALSSVSVVMSSLALKLYKPSIKAENFGVENVNEDTIAAIEE
ncbi:HMA5 Probable copper-transporting ATPase HMA5 [Candida maltosa Xu316]